MPPSDTAERPVSRGRAHARAHNARERGDRQPDDRTFSRTFPSGRSSLLLRGGAGVLAVGVTGIAFWANFVALKHFAEHQGGMPVGLGWQLPVVLDVLVGLGVLRYMDVSLRLLRRSRLGVLLIVLGSTGTIAGNVAHSWSNGPMAIATAVVFPVVLLLGWETAMLMLRERLESTPAPSAPPARSAQSTEQSTGGSTRSTGTSAPPVLPEPPTEHAEHHGVLSTDAPERDQSTDTTAPPRLHPVPVTREQIREHAVRHWEQHGVLPTAQQLAGELGCGRSTAGKVLPELRQQLQLSDAR